MIQLGLKWTAQVLKGNTPTEGEPVEIKGGDKVRIVQRNGCMAHTRDNPKEGVVIGISWLQLYGDYGKYRFAKICLDNGEIVDKPARKSFWTMHDGLPEYGE